ncbi:hypothetical protein EXIGLDRAFT_253213 [Exidia glandulosa HHB12029]|uniref:MYND-type domain-containing protein n=1 Tax=Exidia glandulosa HHB12029 TaxID=1314781 RepID=A0A165DY68_EXIGL|nr:hypothetical protein EXIGLDRAFT_253213 [Exidia glandulosa HHB12029]
MATLSLLARVFSSHYPHIGISFKDEVIPAVLNMLRTQPRDNALIELCLQVLYGWSVCMINAASWAKLFEVLARLCRFADKISRYTFSQILFELAGLVSVASTHGQRFDAIAQHLHSARKVRSYFVCCLRSDSASDRLAALRGLCYMTGAFNLPWNPRSEWDPDAVTTLHADQMAQVEDQIHSFGHDPAASDAAHFCDLRDLFYDSMRRFCVDKDLRKLAHELYRIIAQDPLVVSFIPSVTRHFLENQGPSAAGLPFHSWDDTLKYCVQELRREADDSPTDDHEDVVTVLEAWDLMLDGDVASAADLVRPMVSQQEAGFWYYYVLAESGEPEDIVIAWNALDFTNMHERLVSRSPTFAALRSSAIYRGVLFNIAEQAMRYVISAADGRSPEEWSLRASLLIIAESATAEYMTVAPFDARNSLQIYDIRLVAEIISIGHTLHLQKIEDMKKLWTLHTQGHSNPSWNNMRPRFLQPVLQCFFDEHKTARATCPQGRKHIPTTPRTDGAPYDSLHRGDIYTPLREATPSQIADWRAMLRGERNGRYARVVSWSDAPRELLPEILLLDYPAVRMRWCTYCDTRSVVLRRCGACRRTHYCGKDCQRKHWREGHQSDCPRDYL